MRQIGALEAKNRLGQVLDWVEAGEQVVITRRGKVVAHIMPPGAVTDPERALRAAARIRQARKGITLGDITIRELIDEGRR